MAFWSKYKDPPTFMICGINFLKMLTQRLYKGLNLTEKNSIPETEICKWIIFLKNPFHEKNHGLIFFFQGAPKSVKLLTHLGIGNNSWSFQNSNSLKNWWWEIFTYPISTFRCRNCRSSESDYFSILNFIQSSGRTCKTLIKVWKMFLCEFRRLRHDIFSDVYYTQCYDFTHATFWLHAI